MAPHEHGWSPQPDTQEPRNLDAPGGDAGLDRLLLVALACDLADKLWGRAGVSKP